MALTRDGNPGEQAGTDDGGGTDDGLSEEEERDALEGIGGSGSRAGGGDGDGLTDDEERDALEGIGGSGSRAGSGDEERLRDDEGMLDDDDDDSTLSPEEERDVLEGVGGSGSRAGSGDEERLRDDEGTRDDGGQQPTDDGAREITNDFGGGEGRATGTEGNTLNVGDIIQTPRGQREIVGFTDGFPTVREGDTTSTLSTELVSEVEDVSQRTSGDGLSESQERDALEGIGGSGSRAGGGEEEMLREDEGLTDEQRRNVQEGIGGSGSRAGGGDGDALTEEQEREALEGIGGTGSRAGGGTEERVRDDDGTFDDADPMTGDDGDTGDVSTAPDDVPDGNAPGVADGDGDGGGDGTDRTRADQTTDPDSSPEGTRGRQSSELPADVTDPEGQQTQASVRRRARQAVGLPFSLSVDTDAASETARDVVDAAVDLSFQESEEVAPAFGLRGQRAREDRIDLSGPTITLEEGPGEEPDTDITDALTEGRGLFSEADERELRRDIRRRREFFGVGAEAEALAEDLTGSETAGEVAGGLGSVPGEVAAAPAAATLATDTASEVAVNAPEVVSREGAATVGLTAAQVAGQAVGRQAAQARRNPARFGGQLAGEVAVGTAATRLGTGVAGRARSARVRAQADETVDLEDITNEQGTGGELPNFETSTDAPTAEAVEEVRERAADNPDVVTERLETDRALFQSTQADFGGEFEARRGSSELPGLFTSPDASPLRLEDTSRASLTDVSLRLPRGRDFRAPSDRFAGFEGDRIEGFPDEATGSGRRRTGPDEFEPDPETSGAQFLDEEAARGTAFVRPPGSRTTELEAIFPPGSEFQRTGQLAVNLPSGRAVPLELFRRADDIDADGTRRASGVDIDGDTDIQTSAEVSRSLRRSSQRPRDTPIVPPIFSSGGAGMTSSGSEPTSLATEPDPPTLDGGSGSTTPGVETSRPSSRTPSDSDDLGGSVSTSPDGTTPSMSDGLGSGGGSGGGGDGGPTTSPSGVTESEVLSPTTPPSGAPSGGSSSPGGPSSTPPGGSGGPGSAGPSEGPPGSSAPPTGPSGPSSSGGGVPGGPGGPPTSAPPSFTPTPSSPSTPEPELDFGDDSDDDRRRRRLSDFEKRFQTAVATPEDVLSAADEDSLLEDG